MIYRDTRTLCLWFCVGLFPLLPIVTHAITFESFKRAEGNFLNVQTELQNSINHLTPLYTEQGDIKVAWDVNREELRDQGIELAASGTTVLAMAALSPISPSGLVSELNDAAVLAGLSALDLSEQYTLDALLGTAIGKVNMQLSKIGTPAGTSAATGLFKKRDDTYETYRQAWHAYFSQSSNPPLKMVLTLPSYKKYSFSCAGNSSCDNTFDTPSEAISGDFVPCWVNPHSGMGFGWYSCLHSVCPASDEHYVVCEGTCGRYFPPPLKNLYGTILMRYDHGYLCGNDLVGSLLNCPVWRFTCSDKSGVKCANYKNHAVPGACGIHKVKPSELSKHAALSTPMRCPVTYTYSGGTTVQCTKVYRYKCEPRHSDHDFPSVITNPDVSPDPPPVVVDNTPDCSYCTDGCSSCDSPTDDTPNCSDCISHCSSPCSCTNSGTCNGTVFYHACGAHETSVSGDHTYGTYTCGIHSGYKCQESHDHKTYISSCTQTDANGNTCTNSSGYYECSQHTHTYPPSLVACGGASYTGCSGASSRTEHHVPLCSNGCGNGYWTCDPNASLHTETKTCKRSGCGATLTPCQNGPTECINGGYHWL